MTALHGFWAAAEDGLARWALRHPGDAERLDWSADAKALKVIFVCGNEPADQDPSVTLQEAAELAGKRGIVINTIYCGGADDSDGRTWRQLAALAKGQDPNGGWVNKSDSFMEGDPNIVTSYALLALAAARRAGR